MNNNFEISYYLNELDKSNGSCKKCSKKVGWARLKVGVHVRNCKGNWAAKDKIIFQKECNFNDTSSESDVSMQSDDDNAPLASTSTLKFNNEEANAAVADFFYLTGTSFRVADSGAFKKMIQSVNPSFTPPTAKVISTTLLNKKYEEIKNIIDSILAGSSNLILCSDGWTNVRGDHLVNFCIKTNLAQPIFFKAVNTSAFVQNSNNVASCIITVLEEIGPEKFAAIITDNAPVMKAAWKMVEDKFPHIIAQGCAAHAMNLVVKDILDVRAHKKIMDEAKVIVKFVNNHHLICAKFDIIRKQEKVTKKLAMPVITRWFSHYNTLKNVFDARFALMKLVDGEKDIITRTEPKTTSANFLKIVKNASFWEDIEKLISNIELPSNMIGT